MNASSFHDIQAGAESEPQFEFRAVQLDIDLGVLVGEAVVSEAIAQAESLAAELDALAEISPESGLIVEAASSLRLLTCLLDAITHADHGAEAAPAATQAERVPAGAARALTPPRVTRG